jgi:exopolysaccharide production protein ExoZ
LLGLIMARSTVRLTHHQTPQTGLTSVQALRGLAALGVVSDHVSFIMGQPQYGSHSIWPETLEYGKLGVNLFFVLSGFIILRAHLADLGRPSRLARYLYRKVVRIYPVYWIFLTLYVVAAAAHFGFPEFAWAPGNLLQAYTLLPLSADVSLPLHELILPLKVAWTLAYEIEFSICSL